jgi:hypothetical protein
LPRLFLALTHFHPSTFHPFAPLPLSLFSLYLSPFPLHYLLNLLSYLCRSLQLFYARPVFRANRELDQLDCIARACGSITPTVWPAVVALPLYATFCPRDVHPRNLAGTFSK